MILSVMMMCGCCVVIPEFEPTPTNTRERLEAFRLRCTYSFPVGPSREDARLFDMTKYNIF